MELSTRTPPKITEAIRALCRKLDASQEPGYVPVRPDPGSEARECFFNVRDKVERDGGRIQFGWAIWEWPRVMIEAEFHAIWVSPEGERIDITPKPEGISKVLFLQDSSRTYDYSRAYYRIDNIRRRLSSNPLVADFIAICEERFRFEETHSPGPVLNLEGPALDRWEELVQRQASIQVQLMSLPEPSTDFRAGRNDPCPCGSGLKFKKCCGKR